MSPGALSGEAILCRQRKNESPGRTLFGDFHAKEERVFSPDTTVSGFFNESLFAAFVDLAGLRVRRCADGSQDEIFGKRKDKGRR